MTGPAAIAVELRGLTKDFASGLRGVKLRAVDRLDLRVGAGEVFGLLGPNGSGKSTTIKIVLGLLEPSGGECRVFGESSARSETRRTIGYLPESPQFYRHLSGRELVRFYARLSGFGGARLHDRVEEAIAWVGLESAADRSVGTYSKGMLQRIGFAQAVVHDPRLVILDEPTAGVDPAGAAAMVALIRQLKAQGKTVLITSHRFTEMEDLCDRVAILERGRLLLCGAVEDLTGGAARMALNLDRLAPEARQALRTWLGERGLPFEPVALPGTRLEQVYLAQVERREPEATAAGDRA